jgi:tRNA nucleotidyltransferase (CCA-adding enzyme)
MTSKPKKQPQRITVITTHINADFDAVASMLAAQKLYPNSVVVFPGSQEKNLRNFFVNSMAYLFNMADIKDIDAADVRRLVLVDTRQPHRIGKLSELLKMPNLEIHAYDHHPAKANDVRADLEHVRITGATVTILTEILAERNIAISPEEATIMCLGIYEDTGSFTFSSTTEADFRAAAFLLSKGADLNIVSSLISREINPEQVGILSDMIQAATWYSITGIDVLVTSVSRDAYVPDFAFLVQKMVKMENLDSIFAIARMEDKVYVVARSRIGEVDAGSILEELGGGGHPYAAAATIKNKTLTQVEHQLVELLYQNIRSRRLARDLMSAPPISVSVDTRCRVASEMLTRYNINALLVTRPSAAGADSGDLAGLITRQVIEKALFHKLDHVPVGEYMTTEVVEVGPKSDLTEIQDKIIEHKQRILPVIEQGKILGVITRTDLLNILVRKNKTEKASSPDPLLEPGLARKRPIAKFMRERLPQRIIDLLKKIGSTADDFGYPAYVVGGFVRDLFLYRSNEDIDIVIEGDGLAFARKFAKQQGARIHAYAKFGTAVVTFPDGFKIDIASARMEYYKFPAALPIVEMSSIKLDLYRRDFTINCLAIQLNSRRYGILIDFFSAQKDIKEKVIRVLHNLSFVEDPTRVFRAIRFEQRFGFTVGKLTTGLIENAVKMDFFKRLSGKRVFTELRLILEEENPTPAMVRLHEFNLLKVVHSSIVLNKEMIQSFNTVRKVLAWYDLLFLEESYMRWTVYFLALIRHMEQTTTEEICRRFELAPRLRRLFTSERLEAERCLTSLERSKKLKNSQLYNKLVGFRIELILYMMAVTRKETVKRAISKHITTLRYIRISLRGKDIKNMGLAPGPIYREVLHSVLEAKLDGKLKTKTDEVRFVKQYLKAAATSIPQ